MQPIEISTPLWQLLISVVAILLAPIVALEISKYLERSKLAKERKYFIFSTLMATRATRLAPEHIRVLNMIEVEFYGKREKDADVVEAWKVYVDALNDATLLKNNQITWRDKVDTLFIDLMQKMAISLNFNFDKSILTKTSYYPEAHGNLDTDFAVIRNELIKILRGEQAFPVDVWEFEDENKEKQTNDDNKQ